MGILVYEGSIAAGAVLTLDLKKYFDRPGMMKYLYIGHVQVDIDEVGVNPTVGFEIVSNLLNMLGDTADTGPVTSCHTVAFIEFGGNLGFVHFREGDVINVKNNDGNAYRCQIRMVIDEDYKKE